MATDPKKIYNEKTKRYVFRDRSVGRQLVKEELERGLVVQFSNMSTKEEIKDIKEEIKEEIISNFTSLSINSELQIFRSILQELEQKELEQSYRGISCGISYNNKEEFEQLQYRSDYQMNKKKMSRLIKRHRGHDQDLIQDFDQVYKNIKMDTYYKIIKPAIIIDNISYKYTSISEFNQLFKINFEKIEPEKVEMSKYKKKFIDTSAY